MLSHTFLALCALPAVMAHFKLEWPASRGFDEDKESSGPCGGYDSVSSSRTDFPISGAPIQLTMGHTQTNVAVYMAIGDNPGNGFNIVAKQQLVVTGLGEFCLGSISVPSGVNVSDGTKATIQVITNGHENGGLYQCADVTLRSAPLSQSDFASHCKNNTGVKVSQENLSGNPNGTSSSSGGSPSASGSGSAAAPTSSKAAAPHATAISWVLGAVGVAGMAML